MIKIKSFCLIIMAVMMMTAHDLSAQESGDHWKMNYNTALQQAREENKMILLSFAGSDWCKPCIKLTREVFEKEQFQTYAEKNLILLQADFPRMKKNKLAESQVLENEKMAKKFNKDGIFPLVILLSPDETVIAKTGYRPGGAAPFVEYLKEQITE